MRKLFLSSYFSQIANALPGFVGQELTGKSVAFIPSASVVEKMAFYVKADIRGLQKPGPVVN